MDPALQTIGITKSLDVLGITLGSTATYFVFTLFGAYIIEHFRRRTLIFVGLIAIIVAQTAVTITSWRVEVQGDRYLSYLTVVWIFLFQVCSASLIATMHNLYPVELLSLPLRAKGMALYTMFQVGSCQSLSSRTYADESRVLLVLYTTTVSRSALIKSDIRSGPSISATTSSSLL